MTGGRPSLQPGTQPSDQKAASEEEELWRLFSPSKDQVIRERLFSRYIDFAKGMARRHYHARNLGDLELADLEQYAFAALLEAIDRFDPTYGAPFKAFASPRIAGNITDGIQRANEVREQLSWSRRMQKDRVRTLLPETEGGSALEALTELAVGLAIGFMLEDTTMFADGGAEVSASTNIMPYAWQSLAWNEMKTSLTGELAALGEREHTILTNHYLHGMAFANIAALLAISKSRVSQLHRSALTHLRKRMANLGHFHLER